MAFNINKTSQSKFERKLICELLVTFIAWWIEKKIAIGRGKLRHIYMHVECRSNRNVNQITAPQMADQTIEEIAFPCIKKTQRLEVVWYITVF